MNNTADINLIQNLNKISKTYGIAASELLQNLNGASSLKDVRKLFEAFHSKFTMVPELWIRWIQLEQNQTFEDFDASLMESQITSIKTKKHFWHSAFDDDDKAWMTGNFVKQLFFKSDFLKSASKHFRKKPTTTMGIQNSLTFPHFHLDQNLRFCQKYGTEPISPTTYKMLRYLKHWINFFTMRNHWYNYHPVEGSLETGYIGRSFEYYLGKFPEKRDIWTHFIVFTKCWSWKLNIFSRYCRLFLDDTTFRRESYLEHVKIYNIKNNASIWWIDLIEIERILFGMKAAEEMLKIAIENNDRFNDEKFENYKIWFENCEDKEEGFPVETATPYLKFLWKPTKTDNFLVESQPRSPKFYNSVNSIRQNFSLPYEAITYVRCHSNAALLQKLFQTSKFFFQKSQTPQCHRMAIFDDCVSTYFQQSLFLDLKNANFVDNLKNLTVTNLFQVNVENSPNLTSMLIPKLQFQIQHLQLHRQNLTDQEFGILANERIQSVILDYVVIRDSETAGLIEEIIRKFPNAEFIRIISTSFVPNSAKNLSNLSRNKNLRYIYLGMIPPNFGMEIFTFFKKFMLPKSKAYLKFASDVAAEQKTQFEEAGKKFQTQFRLSVL